MQSEITAELRLFVRLTRPVRQRSLQHPVSLGVGSKHASAHATPRVPRQPRHARERDTQRFPQPSAPPRPQQRRGVRVAFGAIRPFGQQPHGRGCHTPHQHALPPHNGHEPPPAAPRGGRVEQKYTAQFEFRRAVASTPRAPVPLSTAVGVAISISCTTMPADPWPNVVIARCPSRQTGRHLRRFASAPSVSYRVRVTSWASSWP